MEIVQSPAREEGSLAAGRWADGLYLPPADLERMMDDFERECGHVRPERDPG